MVISLLTGHSAKEGNMKKLILPLGILILFPFIIRAQEVGSLKIKIDGFKNDNGCVRVALANSPENYSAHKDVFRGASVGITGGQAVCVFDDIPYGEYAVKVFHDENDNGDLDTNFLGIPSEDYGFSNNASGTFGPPGWPAARFEFKSVTDSISITVD